MERKRFNLKATFRGGQLDRLECGDFGPVPGTEIMGDYTGKREDCYIAWPVDPRFTGRTAIPTILGWPVTDRFYRDYRADAEWSLSGAA